MHRSAVHGGLMSDNAIEPKPANPKADAWAERIAAQQRSGRSVKQFCKEQGLTECSFYAWRKRLGENGPVRFALVERSFDRPTKGPGVEMQLDVPAVMPGPILTAPRFD